MRSSARLRLTIAFTIGALSVGAAIVVAVFLVMRFVPDYRLVTADAVTGHGGSPSVGDVGAALSSTGFSDDLPDGTAAAITVRGESDVLRLLLVTSGIVLGVTTLGCIALSWYFAGRVLRPVQQLSAAAAVADHGVGSRIPVQEPADEFGRLAGTLNEMFDRLDRSFAAQQRFAANASHELRTPLATTQAMLDVALAAPDAVDVPRLAGRLRETNARSIGTVSALLELADAQSGTIEPVPVDLHTVVADAVTAVRSDATDRGIRVDARIEARTVPGDAALLDSMVGNLLRNAVRHNVDGGSVLLVLDAVGLRVRNTGPVIDPADVPRLVEPFFRTAGRVAGSHGIGLALVDAVATLHGADLAITAPEHGGLCVDVVFPDVVISHASERGTADSPEPGTSPAFPTLSAAQ